MHIIARLTSQFFIVLHCRSAISIPVDLINSTDEVLSKCCPGLKAKRDAISSVLQKNKITSKDLETRILATWVDLSKIQIEGFLESHGISTNAAPPIWNEKFAYCVLGQEGKVRCESEGLEYDDRLWLFKTCNALGLEYEGMGRVSEHQHMEKDRHLVALRVPKNCTFKPDRQVAFVNLCGVCNGENDRSDFVGSDDDDDHDHGDVTVRQTPLCEECHDRQVFAAICNIGI